MILNSKQVLKPKTSSFHTFFMRAIPLNKNEKVTHIVFKIICIHPSSFGVKGNPS